MIEKDKLHNGVLDKYKDDISELESNLKISKSDHEITIKTYRKQIEDLDGRLEAARKSYDKARKGSKQLLSFYRDLSGAFRGLDARIPREMDTKGREARDLLAKSNLRLAALFRRKNQPEIAVPLLIEVVKIMTPAKPYGQKAYQRLLELGFVNTPYSAANPNAFN